MKAPPSPPSPPERAGIHLFSGTHGLDRLVAVLLILAGALTALAGAPVITNPPVAQTVFLGDLASFSVGASGTAPLNYQWFRNGAAVAGARNSTLVFTTVAADSNSLFSVQVTNSEGTATSSPVLLTIDFGSPGPVQTNRLLEVTNTWRFSVSKADLGTNWTSTTYDDSGWPGGGGLLYLEDSAMPAPKTSPLPVIAGSLPTTCYFRTRFTNNLATVYSLKLIANTVIDDGVVCYLNGGEAFRLGMPDGVVTYGTLAGRRVDNAVWEGPTDVPTTNLVAGTNVLAAEVHQIETGSTDIVMGLALDAVWQGRVRDTNAPVVTNVVPSPGETVAKLTQIEVQFNEPVRGVDAADLRINGLPATNVAAIASGDYLFQFPQPATGNVSVAWAAGHGITDCSANSNVFLGSGFGYVFASSASTATRLSCLSVMQSTDATSNNGASRAVDGSTATFSLTKDLAGSYWLADLGRPYPLARVEIVNRAAPSDLEMAGLVLRLFDMDDQVVFQTSLANPGSGGTAVVNLPAGTSARLLWIGLPGSQTNGAGNHRVGLAEVRVLGQPNMLYGPAPVPTVTNQFTVAQSSEYGGYPALNAVDGDANSFTHTANLANSFWIADLRSERPIDRVEVVNRIDCCDNRLSGLVLRILNAALNSVASITLPNPGAGGTFTFRPPAGTAGRYVKIGLENNQYNGGGNYYVTLAEVRAYSGATNWLTTSSSAVAVTNNLASFKRSYMVRLSQSIPAAANANDDNYSTETKTTTQTVDGYWEVDLGATYALYGVRTIGAGGIGYRMTNTICRLFDEAHDSVFAAKLTGGPDVFDTELYGPRFARYVRVGLEDKQRTDPSGGLEWYIGMREVEVFGIPTNTIGILSFSASTNRVAPGGDVTLSWTVNDVRHVEIRPGIGSVGAYTATNGMGSFNVIVTNSTEFILIATNAAGIFSRAVSVEVASNALPVRISEIVAENKYSLEDGYGDASDWIELRNCGNSTVDLTGWGLSDDAAQPMKWTFPSTNLAPHSTLIVFASGSGAPFDPARNLHASFRLSKEGGSLLLTASDGSTVVDRLENYPPLDTDLAYGRDLEGKWTFMEPTPRQINTGASYAGWLSPLSFSHRAGFYDTAFTLTITNTNPGATVLYSLDGTVPSVTYTGRVSISRTKSLRAQVVRPGYKPARIQTRTFIFLNDVITSSVMNTAITQNSSYAPRMKPGLLALPTISLSVPSTPTYDEQEGSVEVLWPNGADPVQENCGIYRYGGSWQPFDKASFTVAFRRRYGNGKLQCPLFNGFDHGVLVKTSFDKLELNGGNQDMNARGFYMADRFVQDSLLDMGSLNPHGRFVHVYLNGVYWGQYNCKEVLMENFLADYLGGTSDDYVSVKGNDNVGDSFVVGTPDAPNTQPWERVLALRTSYADVRPYLDVSHLIDFMLLWFYGDAESEYRACGPREAGTGFKFWLGDSDGFLRTDALGMNRLSSNGPGDLFSGLVGQGHTDFKMLMADRIYRHFFNQGALMPAANTARLNARMTEIHDSLLAECARWGHQTPTSWENAAATIRSSLFPTRTSQLVGYLRSAGFYPALNPPSFNQYGGLVTNGFLPVITSSSGTIYYTLDGSDPRLAGGGISLQARVWAAGAVTVTNDLTLNIRVRSSAGVWSALAQPRYLLANRRPPTPQDLWITEINYNPVGGNDYEFIELYNAGTNLLDLSGVSLSNAVRYLFPAGYALGPGVFTVVAKNTTAFGQRYQTPGTTYYTTNLSVAGPWSGSLDNSGETLVLVASNGVELSSVPYKPSGDWPARADGQGSSIELNAPPPAPATDPQVRAFIADGGNWTASSLYHGSPGRFDTNLQSICINEILSHSDPASDWIELLNTGSREVDFGGCAMTDSLDQPRRWMFPTNLVLQPGQYLVLSSAQLGFAFSELGESAYLLQLEGTNVLRFVDSVEFPAAALGESLGRFERADGQVDFTELRSTTPGAGNALPRVGPVVISEIMATPLPGQAEYVELASITNGPVPLFDALHPTNVWKLDGVGSFAFPTGTVLEACSCVIICSTNPAAFRAQYGINQAVPVFGPWSGALDDDGETLKLLRPGDPRPDGTIPCYRVDHVSYRANSPWPSPQPGVSIERVPLEAYGNDPVYWRSGPSGGTSGVPSANRLPVITVTGNPLVPVQTPVTLTVAVADLDVPWQTIALVPVQLPAGSAFDPVLGTFSWTPSPVQGPGVFTAQFTATDSAACGGTNQTSVEITIEVTQSPVLSALYLAGEVRLTFTGHQGETYRVEYCTDLAAADWQLLQETVMTESQPITVIDGGISSSQARFYRVRWMR